MIYRLRTLSPLLRYPVYFACVLLMLFVAVGVGATAAVVVGWQSERSATSTSGTSDAGETEGIGASRESEGTALQPSGGSTNGTNPGAPFVHLATEENSRGDFTYISDPRIDGDANAVVMVSPTPDRESGGGAFYEHNIGVWYEGRARRWAIFNQDLAPVPAGSTFEVVIPQEPARFVHRADLLNIAGNYTYLDHRLTNGEPDAVLSVTQNWNPGGGGGVYNDHPVEILYDANLAQWTIYNRDGAPIPEGAAFNVAVSTGADGPAG